MRTAPRMRNDALYIVGAGAQTPLGRSVLSAAAAVRCGLSAGAQHPYVLDHHGEPMVVAYAPWLDLSIALEDRIVSLAAGAVREAIHPIAGRFDALRRHLNVYIALSAENLEQPAERQRVLDRIAVETGLNTETGRTRGVECIVDGHAGGLLALERAARQLVRGETELCLVGAADSWIGVDSLEALDYTGRLHSVTQRWGFTPGEGAAFCLVTTGLVARRLALTPLAELLAVASAPEANVLGSGSICTGAGLTSAFLQVLNGQPRVSHSYCDLNGETYRAEEYGFAICRVGESFEHPDRFTAPAGCWGDAGAASGLLAATMPLAAWARGYAEGPVQLAWSSSATSPLRAAALLQQPTPSTN